MKTEEYFNEGTPFESMKPALSKTAVSGCKNAVLCAERMPTKEGYYKTSIGVHYLEDVPNGIGLKTGLRWQFGMTPEWWEE